MSAAAPSPSRTHQQVFLQNRFFGISDTAASFCLPVPPLSTENNKKKKNKGSDNIIKDYRKKKKETAAVSVLRS